MGPSGRPRHLADRDLAGDPKELARAAFTHHWARCFLAAGGRDPLAAEHLAVLEEATRAVGLLYQVGVAPIRDLAEGYFADAGLHELALSFLKKGALDSAFQIICRLCEALDPEIATPLHDFLFLVNETAPHLRADVLRLVDQEQYGMARRGLLTDSEINFYVLEAMCRHLGPTLAGRCGLEVHDFVFCAPYVAHEASRSEWEGITIGRCLEAAGRYDVGGNARPPPAGWGGDPPPYEAERADVRLFDEVNNICADTRAFYPVGSRPEGLLEKELARLASDLGGSPHDRADRFREWYGDIVLWHEEGHVLAGDHVQDVLRRRADGFGGDEFEAKNYLFSHRFGELHADARVVERLAAASDEALTRFWVSLPLEEAGAGAERDASQPPSPSRCFVAAHAVLTSDPRDRMRRFLDELDATVAEKDAEECVAWIDQRVNESRDAVTARLARTSR